MSMLEKYFSLLYFLCLKKKIFFQASATDVISCVGKDGEGEGIQKRDFFLCLREQKNPKLKTTQKQVLPCFNSLC